MMRSLFVLLSVVPVLAVPFPTGGADAPQPHMLIDKAIAAAGGWEKLDKCRTMSWKEKSRSYEAGKTSEYSCEWVHQLPSRARVTVVELDGFKRTIMWVLNGDKAWISVNGRVEEAAAEVLLEGQEKAYAAWVATLTPLADKAFNLDALGEKRVADRLAVGVRVSFKGRRDVNLYFDKETGLMRSVEIPIKVPFEAKEHVQELIYSDYKEIDGVKRPTRFMTKWDGQLTGEGEIFDQKPHERLDDDVFATPK